VQYVQEQRDSDQGELSTRNLNADIDFGVLLLIDLRQLLCSTVTSMLASHSIKMLVWNRCGRHVGSSEAKLRQCDQMGGEWHAHGKNEWKSTE
jgi:hypothetical protein